MPPKSTPPAPKSKADYPAWAQEVLDAHRHLNFVQRLFDPTAPVSKNPTPGSWSSHLMASGDGRVYPTLVEDPALGSLYTPKDPGKYALATGEYIQFPDDHSAKIFANNVYKQGAPPPPDTLDNWLFLPEERKK